MHVLAEGGQQIEVFGGGHSIEVVTGSLKLAAGELGAYQPDWARLSATCSSAPSGYGLPPHFIEVTGALHRLSAAAQETAAKMRLAHNRIEHLEEDLVRAAEQYEQAESENLGTIGFADDDATWGTVMNMMEASPNAKYAIGAGAGLTYVPGLLILALQGKLNPEGIKELGAKNVKGLFSIVFPKAPKIKMEAKERRPVQRADASKLSTWIEQQQLAGQGRGSIVVSKVVTEAGKHAWIVTLPGTNDSKGTVWGLPRMKQAFNRETDDVRKAVDASLKDAGAKPGKGSTSTAIHKAEGMPSTCPKINSSRRSTRSRGRLRREPRTGMRTRRQMFRSSCSSTRMIRSQRSARLGLSRFHRIAWLCSLRAGSVTSRTLHRCWARITVPRTT